MIFEFLARTTSRGCSHRRVGDYLGVVELFIRLNHHINPTPRCPPLYLCLLSTCHLLEAFLAHRVTLGVLYLSNLLAFSLIQATQVVSRYEIFVFTVIVARGLILLFIEVNFVIIVIGNVILLGNWSDIIIILLNLYLVFFHRFQVLCYV